MTRLRQLMAVWMFVADYLLEARYNRQRVQGRHDDVDEYPYVTRME
jgi:hypothetical protein